MRAAIFLSFSSISTVFELVESIEASFAEILGADEFDAMRQNLCRLADLIDPSGAFGNADENAPEKAPRSRDLRRS